MTTPRGSVSRRIESKIRKTETGCWEWIGGRHPKGYGCAYSHKAGRAIPAHRLSYETYVGVIPAGMMVRHKCDNPPCVNPDHLEVGTAKQNTQDAISRGRMHRGERSGPSKLRAPQVIAVRLFYECGFWGYKSLGDIFGVDFDTIRQIVKGNTWKHLLKNA